MSDDPLAFDRRLTEYRDACRNAMTPGSHPGWADIVATLRGEFTTGTTGHAARLILDRAMRRTRVRASVAQYDDALAFIEEFWVPAILPDPTCTTLEAAYGFHLRTDVGEAGPRIRMVYAINGYVLEQRSRALAQDANHHHRYLSSVIGSATVEGLRLTAAQRRHMARSHKPRYLSEYDAAQQVNQVRTARSQLATALTHGLAYSYSPSRLLATPGTGRIAGIADQARTQLARYVEARQTLGWDRLPRGLDQLVETAQPIAPTSFAR